MLRRDPDAVASGLIHDMSGAWASAAALSLTLITVVGIQGVGAQYDLLTCERRFEDPS
jgi:hypothetical protein